MADLLKKILPPISLALLSTIIAELLSGSAPPLIFFNPLQFLIRFSLYGSGIIIIRELCIKWGKGWASLLILGLAMGIIWEGLAAKAIFRPTWTGIDIIGNYGRWLEVNWVTGTWLVLFHIIFSVAVTILIFNFLFPEKKYERLISDRKLIVVFIILFIIVSIFYFWISPYDPMWQQICILARFFTQSMTPDVIITLALICNYFSTPYVPDGGITLITLLFLILLFIIAWKIKPDALAPKNDEPTISSKWFFIVGAIYTASTFIINVISPHVIPYPIIPIIIEIVLLFSLIFFDVRFSGKENKKYHVLALISGLLSFFIFIAFFQELRGQTGMSIVGIFFILFLYYIKRRLDKE